MELSKLPNAQNCRGWFSASMSLSPQKQRSLCWEYTPHHTLSDCKSPVLVAVFFPMAKGHANSRKSGVTSLQASRAPENAYSFQVAQAMPVVS